MQNQTSPEKLKYASFNRRIFASVIDSILSALLLLPLVDLFTKIYGRNELQEMLASGSLDTQNISPEKLESILHYQLMSFTWQFVPLSIVIVMLWIYRSATPGKMMLKMKIVDEKTGGHPTKKQLIIRYLGYFVAFLPLGLGFIWIHYDKKRQGWHDKMAGTVVIIEQK